jgi:GNAT superfamily N-acetyltransferase
MKYIIRKARIDDLKNLSDLFFEFTGLDSDLIAMKKQLEIMTNDPNYFVAVATADERVIGTSMAIKCLDLVGNCNPFLIVENVVVFSQFRGKGIGKLLMQSIEDFGMENSCNYIILVSGNNREQAHEFYKSVGYSSDNQGFKKRLLKQS